MDTLGLPLSFGKQQAVAEPAVKPQVNETTRGEASGRGSRGVVGGGKRKRGRGAPSSHQDAGWPVRYQQAEQENKRANIADSRRHPLPTHPSLPPPPDFGLAHQRGTSHHLGNGQRRNGGGTSSRGHGTGGGGGNERGFFRESFCEDPWKDLMEKRAREKSKGSSQDGQGVP